MGRLHRIHRSCRRAAQYPVTFPRSHSLPTATTMSLSPADAAKGAAGAKGESAAGRRTRDHSAMDFKSAATGVTAKAMRAELNKLVQGIKDPEYKQAFEAEMQSFFILFNRYLAERVKNTKIEWDKIKPPAPEQVVAYSTLKDSQDPSILDKLAVLKLNGGLGTTMGCVGPKSVIEVREGMTFLDLSVRQIEHLNSEHNVNVPFILMNSFNTDEDTARVIQKYANHNIEIMTFNQSRFPRVNKESLLPSPRSATEDRGMWYPPGHGDLYDALTNSGLLDRLLAAGKEYIFVSNVDNLGAVVDMNILQHMIDSQAEFLMEVTDKTKADVNGWYPYRLRGHYPAARDCPGPERPRRGLQECAKVQDFQHKQPLAQPPGDQARHGWRRDGPRDHRKQQVDRLGRGCHSARDRRRSRHQALPQRARHQRAPIPLPPRQEL